MKYRQFGKLNWKASALGFGAMRLPTVNNDSSKIDENKAIEMIRYAIDNGVNYIDTAWPYHKGNSEIVVGKALKNGYRDKVKLATKLPSWLIKKEEDMDFYLDKQLKKLQVDYIDFYLLHALNRKHWENYKKLNVFKWIEKVISLGKIKYIGFSFHDDYNLFKEIVDAYDWTFCQIQYNYLDTDFQAGKKGLKYASKKGLAIVIMEPLRGGQLAGKQPTPVHEIWNTSQIDRTPVDWALQWLWNQPEVSVVLSGMSTLEQVKENITSADKSGINALSKAELNTINQIKKAYEELSPIMCTGCNYCIPCPQNVNIPGNFSLYNNAHIYNDFENQKKVYNKWDESAKAGNCVGCGQCEKACPQNLPIIKLLKKVDAYFS
ncbi:aldo/keto reductase [Halothermothrix orenii]|uniref:Aldo/keto reductase n=1 Tax=Halothermothrix orenii (strain H 168 / OCM 544 / DSM 9562) TaxID=373903 RepID=B8CW38_HALOH|nr:aldo/keto reductase [Halothermothrix orenii]ACL69507.1 aldo/keto reductase [Halothermothrix orenii H 168]